MESVLFGHDAGAFTDAREKRIGVFEEAGPGVLFLDEIAELEKSLQPKLLRVLQERQFRRVGGKKDIAYEGCTVFATNEDLAAHAATGEFRMDLYHRINVHELSLPSLTNRGDDIWELVELFLQRHAKGKKSSTIT